MKKSVGIRSLALSFPRIVRSNAYWKVRHPDIVATAEERTLARLWNGPKEQLQDPFDVAMAPYLSDPFRGAVVRRIRAHDETALSMESRAARAALRACGIAEHEVDLTLVSSLIADQPGVGNAAYLARELGLQTPALTLESACASSVVGLHTATALVRSESYRRVMVVVSNSSSVQLDESDTLSWFVGDGAAAFIVEEVAAEHGVLGRHTINSIETCDMFRIGIKMDEHGQPALRTAAHTRAGEMARSTAERYLRICCEGALSDAGMSLDDVDFFVFHSPSAFYPAFCARVLGVPDTRWISTYPSWANVGSVVMPAVLDEASRSGRLRPGNVVLAYAVGSSATASAVVMRWGDVALGPPPSEGVPG